jgi:hypothetical protein
VFRHPRYPRSKRGRTRRRGEHTGSPLRSSPVPQGRHIINRMLQLPGSNLQIPMNYEN